MELVLSLAGCELRDDVGRATRAVNLGIKAGRFAYVSSTSTASRKLVKGRRFALRSFARDGSIRVNGVIATDVAGACCGSVAMLEVGLPVRAHRTSTACRVDRCSRHIDLLTFAIKRSVFCLGVWRVFGTERTGTGCDSCVLYLLFRCAATFQQMTQLHLAHLQGRTSHSTRDGSSFRVD